MPLTPEQLEIRPRYLASSEAPTVLGLNPWGTPREVWEAKDTASRKGVITERDAGHAGSVGTYLEAGVLAWYEAQIGDKVECRQRTCTRDRLSATCDGIVLSGFGDTLVEVKCVGRHMLTSWADGPPAYVLAQVHVAAFAHDCAKAVVLMHSEGTSIEVFEVDVSAEAIRPTIDACHRWWERYVIGDTPPPELPAEALGRLASAPHAGEIELVEGEAVDLIARAGRVAEARKVLEAEEVEIKARLAAMLADAKKVKTPAGSAQWITSAPSPDWRAVAEELGQVAGAEALAQARANNLRARTPYLQTYPKKAKT